MLKQTQTDVFRGRRQASNQIGTTFEIRDIIKKMARVEPFQFPWVNMLFLSKNISWRTTSNLQGLFEFPEKEMVPNQSIVTSYVVSGTGSSILTLRVTNDTSNNLFVPTTSITIDITGECGIVQSNNGTDIVVLRDKNSAGAQLSWSALSPIGSGSFTGTYGPIFTLGEARSETDGIPESVTVNPYMRTGRVQLFEKAVSATDMFVAASMGGGLAGGDWFSDDLREKTIEMKRELEMASWRNGDHFIGRDPITNGVITKFSGIPYQIENNGGFIHNHGGTMDKANLFAFFKQARFGSKKKTMFVGDDVAEIVENMVDEKYQNFEAIARYGPIKGDDTINILRIRRFNLIVDIVRVPHFENDWTQRGYMLDDNHIFGCHFSNDKKGTRKFRAAMGVDQKGQPTETATFLSHVGFGLSVGRSHGIFKH
jgi:hypothetical protein